MILSFITPYKKKIKKIFMSTLLLQPTPILLAQEKNANFHEWTKKDEYTSKNTSVLSIVLIFTL